MKNTLINIDYTKFELKINPEKLKQVQEWITSLDDYEKYYECLEKKWWAKKLRKRIYLIWDKLYEIYWKTIDPIVYLMNLYYWEWISTKDINEILNQMWLWYKTNTSIARVFRESFNWEMWLINDERTLAKRQSIENTIVNKINNLQKTKNRIDILKELFKEKTKNIIDNWNCDIEFFNSLNKVNKIIYALEKFYWIKKEDLIKLNKQNKIWSTVIIMFLNDKLIPLLEKKWIKLKIITKEIDIILEKNYLKKK